MKIPRIYVDTSVIGGCHDSEFKTWSKRINERFQTKEFQTDLFRCNRKEISKAPKKVQVTFRDLLEYDHELLPINEDAIDLAENYLERKILTPKYRDDALHIAIATLANANILVSWNFRHIVHYDKIKLFNAVNIENGFKSIDIYSPREVTNYEE